MVLLPTITTGFNSNKSTWNPILNLLCKNSVASVKTVLRAIFMILWRRSSGPRVFLQSCYSKEFFFLVIISNINIDVFVFLLLSNLGYFYFLNIFLQVVILHATDKMKVSSIRSKYYLGTKTEQDMARNKITPVESKFTAIQ